MNKLSFIKMCPVWASNPEPSEPKDVGFQGVIPLNHQITFVDQSFNSSKANEKQVCHCRVHNNKV